MWRRMIPLVRFRRGERKDDEMAQHLSTFDQDEGVVFVGMAQEKASCEFRVGYAT